jgi:hypothetical protein
VNSKLNGASSYVGQIESQSEDHPKMNKSQTITGGKAGINGVMFDRMIGFHIFPMIVMPSIWGHVTFDDAFKEDVTTAGYPLPTGKTLPLPQIQISVLTSHTREAERSVLALIDM